MYKISGKRIYDGGMWIKYYLSILFLNAWNFVFCRAWLKCWICENFLLSKTAVFQWNYFSPAIPLFVPDRTWGCGDGIEKCSSPIGDGNAVIMSALFFLFPIEKCSSPIGDGNRQEKSFESHWKTIEKCSSPIGDGNCVLWAWLTSCKSIEKCSSPIGDGNDYTAHLRYFNAYWEM